MNQAERIKAEAAKAYRHWVNAPDGSRYPLEDAMERAIRVGIYIATKDRRRSKKEVAAPNVIGLTSQQRALLQYIELFMAENGIPPSYDQMREGMGLASKSGIHRLVTALEERGHIERLPNRARAIALRAA